MHFCVRRTFHGKESFWKNKTYLTFTDFERFALHEASTELQNFTFCAGGLFRGKTFVLKQKFNYRSFFELLAKSFRPNFKKKSKVSRRKSSRHKSHFKKIMFVLGLCRCLFRKIGKNIFVRCPKAQFNCPEVHNSWQKTAFGILLIFSPSRVWIKSCLKVLWQFFSNLEKIAIQVSTEIFWTKKFLFLMKTIFLLFTDFHWCIFEPSKKTILSVLSMRHSTYPEERLD